MKTRMEQFPATNPNPVLSVGKDGTVPLPIRKIIGGPLEYGASSGRSRSAPREVMLNDKD